MAEHVYEKPQLTKSVVDGVAVVEASVPDIGSGENAKSHLRAIGDEGTPIAGHRLIYSDTYARGNRKISYARHSVDQGSFLEALETFQASAIAIEFGELRNTATRCVVQTAREIQTLDDVTYQEAVSAM